MRNLGNITAPRLYNRAFAGTKYLIEEYVAQVAGAIEDIDAWPTAAAAPPPSRDAQPQHVRATNTATATAAVTTAAAPLSTQRKLDFLHDSRQALGRSALVLQGGAIFGLCHLGVIRALFLRGLLPRIIVGTATGALVASLVSVHTEEELPRVLRGDGIDLSAFEAHGQLVHGGGDRDEKGRAGPGSWFGGSKWETFVRRAGRLWREGYLLDVKVLEECVKANVGDLTFEEAYNRSKRVLNITVAMEGGREGVPTLLNYITAPNVVSIDYHPFPVPQPRAHTHLYTRIYIHRKYPADNTYARTHARTHARTAHLDGSDRVQCLSTFTVRQTADDDGALQGRRGPGRAVGAVVFVFVFVSVIVVIVVVVVVGQGPQVAADARRAALQREPLRREPGAAVPGAVPAVRHARALAAAVAAVEDGAAAG